MLRTVQRETTAPSLGHLPYRQVPVGDDANIEWQPQGMTTPLVVDIPALFEDALG